MLAKRCPDDESLAVYVSGGSAAPVRKDIAEHVDGCPGCREATSALARMFFPSPTIGPLDPSALSADEDGLATNIDLAELSLEREIGRGGMGIVYRGRQLALGRSVAIKSTYPAGDGAELNLLLAEARIIACLEHPAIVPVYALGRDDDNKPVVVMKNVTGESLGERIARRRRNIANIDADLGVLIAVCNAVAFAHERGIVHRDIKPANILLGDFGEVYLVDWGLAVDVGDANIPGLPRRDQINGVTGSVLYMAPEQARADASSIGPPTDIYLLGATLYEIIAGDPGRQQSAGERLGLLELIEVAKDADRRPLPDWIPPELRAICETALALEPTSRFASATELRDALSTYLAHRGSRRLEAGARIRLREALEGYADSDSERDDAVGRDLAAARFGFEQALESWEDNLEAQSGLRRALRFAIERELADKRVDSATLLLEELGARADKDVVAEVSALGKRIEREREHLARLETEARESDLGVPIRLWRLTGTSFGIAFLVLHLAMNMINASYFEVDHLHYLASTSTLAVVFAIPVFVRRDKLFPNRASKKYVFTLGALLLAQVMVFVCLWSLEVPLPLTLATSLFQLAGSLAIQTVLFDPRTLWTAPLAGAMGVGCLLVPTLALVLVGVAYAAYFIAGSQLRFDDGAS